MIGIIEIVVLIAIVLIVGTPLFLVYRSFTKKRKYPFKIIMHIRRNYGWIINTKLSGGMVKDERGVSMFRVPYGWRKFYSTRELPPSDLIAADGTIQMAKIGETLIFLNPQISMKIKSNPKTGEEIIDMDTSGNGVCDTKLVPVTTQTKYSTLYEIKRATQLANAGNFDWKPIIAYGGLVLLFIGVIAVTYIIWERIDINALQQLTDTNSQVAQTNLEILDKLRGIDISGFSQIAETNREIASQNQQILNALKEGS